MYLEFIPEGSQFCPLLILSPSIPEEAEKLYQALTNLVTDNNAVVDVHALPFISPVDGCRLSAQVSAQDIDENIGPVLIEKTKNHFTWQLTCQGWEWVLKLLCRFTDPDCDGHQWLGPDDVTGGISVILSTTYRQW